MTALAPITYRIACFKDARVVNGYAIHLPKPFSDLRFCVRRHDSREWTIDHYDTGFGFGGPCVPVPCEDRRALERMRRWQVVRATRETCVRWLIDYLRYLKRTRQLRSFGDSAWRRALKAAGL